MILKRVGGPAEEPLLLGEVKEHLRITSDEENTLLEGYLAAARELAEMQSRRTFVTQTFDLSLVAWPQCNALTLPQPPLQSVTSITYIDSNGVTQTLSSADYLVDAASEPGRVILGYGKSWPSATLRPGPAITVRFVAGYGNAMQVPQIYKQALLLLVGHFYENREAVTANTRPLQRVPLAVATLLGVNRGGW